MSKRGHGTGSIEPRGGRHRVRVSVAGRRRDLGTVATQEEAESALRGWSKLVADGEVQATGATLRSYGAIWFDRRETNGARNIVTDRSRWELHVVSAPFIDWPLANIRRRDVRAWLDALGTKRAADRRGKRRLGWQSRKHCLNLLRAYLRDAVDDELLDTNPAAGVVMPPRPATGEEGWTYLLPEEQTRLLTCEAIPAPERLVIEFAIGSGLRQGEQWNLELRDLHVDVAQPFVYVRWGKRGQPPKNGRRRRVPLFGLALRAARLWLEHLPRYAKTNPHGLVFPTARGCRRRDSKPPRGWAAWLRAVGLEGAGRHDGRSVRWHDLRHTCASSLVAGWWGRVWRLDEVRDVLGHSSVTVTERYAHLAPSVLAAAGAATSGELHFPKSAPDGPRESAQGIEIIGRATVDSNHWPSAPEAEPISNDFNALNLTRGSQGAKLRELAERYTRAVASRNRFAHRHGLELAEAVLEMTADASAKERSA